MTHIMIKTQGIYKDIGKIELNSGKYILWDHISNEEPPHIPFGSFIEITLCFEEMDLISGKNGIIWATYDQRQAEIIRDTLITQNINVELGERSIGEYELFQLIVKNRSDIDTALNFIWRDREGLRLKPDWAYKNGQKNESFTKWINNL